MWLVLELASHNYGFLLVFLPLVAACFTVSHRLHLPDPHWP